MIPMNLLTNLFLTFSVSCISLARSYIVMAARDINVRNPDYVWRHLVPGPEYNLWDLRDDAMFDRLGEPPVSTQYLVIRHPPHGVDGNLGRRDVEDLDDMHLADPAPPVLEAGGEPRAEDLPPIPRLENVGTTPKPNALVEGEEKISTAKISTAVELSEPKSPVSKVMEKICGKMENSLVECTTSGGVEVSSVLPTSQVELGVTSSETVDPRTLSRAGLPNVPREFDKDRPVKVSRGDYPMEDSTLTSTESLSIDTFCGLVAALRRHDIDLQLRKAQFCATGPRSSPVGLCTIHQIVYEALMAGSDLGGCLPQGDSEGGDERVPAAQTAQGDGEGPVVEESVLWHHERANLIGQYQPPPTVWNTQVGEVDTSTRDPRYILKATRRAQLISLRREEEYVARIRACFPEKYQPYPLYWDPDHPIPDPTEPSTITWDLVTDFDGPRGLAGLKKTSLIAVARFPEDWDEVGQTGQNNLILNQGIDVCLREVDLYDSRNGHLVLRSVNQHPTSGQYVTFDQEHLTRFCDDFTTYLEWCLGWHMGQLVERYGDGEGDSESQYSVWIAGRIAQPLAPKYVQWLGQFRRDIPLGVLLLRSLDRSSYLDLKRRGLASVESEREEMREYGIVPYSDDSSDCEQEEPLEPKAREETRVAPSSFRPSPAMSRVIQADAKASREHAQYLSTELFKSLNPVHKPEHTKEVVGERYFDNLELTPRRDSGSYHSMNNTASGKREPRSMIAMTPPARRKSSHLAPQSQKKKPLPEICTPELRRALESVALRDKTSQTVPRRLDNTPAHLHLNTFPSTSYMGMVTNVGPGPHKMIRRSGDAVAANNRSPTPSSQGSQASPDQHGALEGEFDQEAKDNSGKEEADIGDGFLPPRPKLKTKVPFTGTRSSGGAGPRIFFDPEPTSEDYTTDWARRLLSRDAETSALLRLAVASEAKLQVGPQNQIYTDLQLFDLKAELNSNPVKGAISALLPSLYHIYGVKGHLPGLLPNMTGPTRFEHLQNFFYGPLLLNDPKLAARFGVQAHPRLLLTHAFRIDRGTCASHLSDIRIVGDDPESRLKMFDVSFHLGGKTAISRSSLKCQPPNTDKLGATTALVWQQLEYWINTFSFFNGENHREPLTRAMEDLKDLFRSDLGLGRLDLARLWTLYLGYYQDLILESFATGLLSHIKNQTDLIAEYETDETDLIARIPPWPRLAPGSTAHSVLYQRQRDYFRDLHQDQGVKTMRELAALRAKATTVPRVPKSGGLDTISDDDSDLDSGESERWGGTTNSVPSKDTPKKKRQDKTRSTKPPLKERFPALPVECTTKGLIAFAELKEKLVKSKFLKPEQDVCLRYLSHVGCESCTRVHLPKEALSGITLSPWLKTLMVPHRGYREDKVITPTSALTRISQLQKAGSM